MSHLWKSILGLFGARGGGRKRSAEAAGVADDYRSYVEHPRFGRGPRLTGLNPAGLSTDHALVIHWHSGPESRISMTAVAADISKQVPATMQVAYYFDTRRVCRDCDRKFIFFAEEQKYWYEELGFRLEVDCVRCHACRRQQHGVERLRERYNELVVAPEPGPPELIELASISVELIAAGTFSTHPRTVDRVRMWLNRLSGNPAYADARETVLQKLVALESRS